MILGIPPLTTRASIQAGWQADWTYDKNNADLSLYGNFLRHLAAALSLPVMDFQKEFPREDTHYTDGVHPNAKGYILFADIAKKTIRKKLIMDNDCAHL